MARNIEIKARIHDVDRIRSRIASLASGPGEHLEQTDTFFAVPRGRLKVRAFANGSGELISYHRASQPGPKESVYTRCPCQDARALVDTLSSVLATGGTVVKRREVFLMGRTRIHLDQVENLGSFVELEVVLDTGEPSDQGEQEALDVLGALGIPRSDLVAGAYIDLLMRGSRRPVSLSRGE
jgi:adenylate cyclase class IV